jgi:tetratricopeptide (TPR) repeat protein
MKTLTAVVAFTVVFALLATDADAAKRRKKKYHSRPAPVTQVDRSDNASLCEGGMMVTADDQIKGCTGLIASWITRERKATAYYNRGNAYVGKNDFTRAIADYTEALTIKRDYPQALFNRAVAHRVSGNAQLAVTDYTAAIMLMPGDADAFAGRGMSYAKLAQHEKALADFNQALKLKPDHLTALTQRGHHNVRLQQWATAISDYEAVLSMQKVSAEAYYGRGVAKVYSGDVKSGQRDMAQAQAFDSGIVGRMTAQGIPQPVILDRAPTVSAAPVAATPPAALSAAPFTAVPATTPVAPATAPATPASGESAKPANEGRN